MKTPSAIHPLVTASVHANRGTERIVRSASREQFQPLPRVGPSLGATVLLALLLLPATLSAATRTVTSLADGGAGSLRGAIASSVNGDTINFSVLGTITLTGGEIPIGRSLTIIGPVGGIMEFSRELEFSRVSPQTTMLHSADGCFNVDGWRGRYVSSFPERSTM